VGVCGWVGGWDSGPAAGGTFPLNKRRPFLTGFFGRGIYHSL